MNSLNILTARVSPPPSPSQSRSNSIGSIVGLASEDDHQHGDLRPSIENETESFPQDTFDESRFETEKPSEETPLLGDTGETQTRSSWWHSIPRRIASSI